MCIAIVCLPGCDVTNFEINLILLIKPLFHVIKKSRQRFEYLENEKNFSVEIKKYFSSFLKSFLWNKKRFLLVGENRTLSLASTNELMKYRHIVIIIIIIIIIIITTTTIILVG